MKLNEMDPYRKPDFRCEERLGDERCMLEIGHRGPHTIPGGWIWVYAGTKGKEHPGGVLCGPGDDTEEER